MGGRMPTAFLGCLYCIPLLLCNNRIMPAEKFFYFGKLVFFSGFRLDICIANRKELHYNKLTAPYLPRNQK
jgi:hypothetical protein